MSFIRTQRCGASAPSGHSPHKSRSDRDRCGLSSMHLRAEPACSAGHALFQPPLLPPERSWNGFRANDTRPGWSSEFIFVGVGLSLCIEPRLSALPFLRQACFSGRIELQTQLSLLEHSRSAWEQLVTSPVSVSQEPQLKPSTGCGPPAATSGAASKARRTFVHNIRPTFAFCLVSDLNFYTVRIASAAPPATFSHPATVQVP